MEDHGRTWQPLMVLTSSPFHGHMTPTLQLATTTLHAKGFSIAIAHSKLNPPNPCNLPSDNLPAMKDSGSFSTFLNTLNNNWWEDELVDCEMGSPEERVVMICQPFSVDQGVNARYMSYAWKIGLELEQVEGGEIERVIKRVMVDDEGEEMRVRVNDMKEMVKESVGNKGSSQESLEGLVNFILSY
ncbi:hypothetical protein L1987_22346 [Smallanthus sonchifolius]|uniref:Uncharacterized protein n=1 Tax=Smallanthus sonchifolius TaxID=185202 RepID=A0ACB9IG36_9ASTR|nr:hypothetical protein L1987_22346 [Smallanthus sonchifolius]